MGMFVMLGWLELQMVLFLTDIADTVNIDIHVFLVYSAYSDNVLKGHIIPLFKKS